MASIEEEKKFSDTIDITKRYIQTFYTALFPQKVPFKCIHSPTSV